LQLHITIDYRSGSKKGDVVCHCDVWRLGLRHGGEQHTHVTFWCSVLALCFLLSPLLSALLCLLSCLLSYIFLRLQPVEVKSAICLQYSSTCLIFAICSLLSVHCSQFSAECWLVVALSSLLSALSPTPSPLPCTKTQQHRHTHIHIQFYPLS
jgi:hypothetical protein